ncbi:MAG: primosomal protein N', partial [Bacteroidia bacterium]|nr:primosomal protein N' [Bacteroidia bacterium]
MNSNKQFADVILPLALQRCYTYAVPAEMSGLVSPGQRVLVQFGKKKIYTAIIYRLHNQAPENYEAKEISALIDEKPVVNKHQIALWEWMSSYYMCRLGEVMKAALPIGLKPESETKVMLNAEFNEFTGLNQREEMILSSLEKNKSISIQDIGKLIGLKHPEPIVSRLLSKKAVVIDEELKESFKPKLETYVETDRQLDEEALHVVFKKLEKAPRQLELLMKYITLSGIFGSDEKKEVKKNVLVPGTNERQAFTCLVKKGIFITYEKETGRLVQVENTIKAVNELNEYQQFALDEIRKSFEDKKVVLLHGVTSSGKTEIYIHLIAEYLKSGKQVLYLLPEIALTTQIINRLRQVFGSTVGVYHSKFPDSERVEIWFNTLYRDSVNNYKVILGVRSSLFLPFSDLGLVIVDEEHENSYKQYNPAPRYNARDAAIMLAGMHGAVTLLGTATPAIETYYNALSGKYGLIDLTRRYLDIKMPEIILADLAEAKRKKLLRSFFTETLLGHIADSLKKGEQVILFQNRRGFAPYLECPSCGWIPRCKNCDVSLTYHKSSGLMLCHYCDYTMAVPSSCAACAHPVVELRGFGTEKIEDEIRIFFPDARVARMDMDSTHSRRAHEKIIAGFENREIDILVGTQMVSKGLHFDDVNVVGIMNADAMLNFPDFRAFERSFQLMEQVSGRAGRKNKQGKVIIQTHDIHHPVISDVVKHDFAGFYKQQLSERKMYHYPPFCRLINIILKHASPEVV